MSVETTYVHRVEIPTDVMKAAGTFADMFLSELRGTYSVVSYWDKSFEGQIYSFHTSSTLLVLYLQAVKAGRADDVFDLLNEISRGAER